MYLIFCSTDDLANVLVRIKVIDCEDRSGVVGFDCDSINSVFDLFVVDVPKHFELSRIQ